ncbi:MAG: Gfo/Idh/MocA family protein [Methanosarcinaceae archaeon]
MSKNLRIGIVGCGAISDIHAQAIRQSGNADLISVFSRSDKNACRVGEKYKTKWSVDWNEFISDPDLDAVSICTPNGNHLDYAKKVAEAGKHIILEKPIEVTLKRAKELIDVCNKNSVQLAVIYQNRFIAEVEELKRQIEKNRLGRLFMGDAYIKWFRSQEYYDNGAWRGTFELDGGGVLINQAIHTIDLLQWLMGDVETVFGQLGTFTHERMEGEDNAVATLRFKNGAIGVIEASTSVQPAQSRRIELHGEKGSAVIDGSNVRITVEGESSDENEKSENVDAKSAGSSSPLGGFSIEPHKKQFETIVDAINNNEKPPVSGEESIKSLEIVMAIYESSKTNAMVNIDDFSKK